MPIIEGTTTKLNERSRTYTFPQGTFGSRGSWNSPSGRAAATASRAQTEGSTSSRRRGSRSPSRTSPATGPSDRSDGSGRCRLAHRRVVIVAVFAPQEWILK